MRSKILAGLCIMAIILVNSVCSVFALSEDGSVEGKYIKTEGSKKIVEYPVSTEVKKLQDKKSSIADLHIKFKKGQIDRTKYIANLKSLGASKEILDNTKTVATFNGTSGTSTVMALSYGTSYSNYIYDLYQQSQIRSYYCGPATAASIISARVHVSYSQNTMASSLRTTSSGTAWYDGAGKTGYPMADTLNKYCNTSWYVPYGTSIHPTSFQSDVVTDIDNNYGVAGDAYEVVGGPHLIGHPNQTIYHWFAIDGYSSYANYIHYADSVAGASSISWNGKVPTYSSMNYKTVATIVDGRGIMW